MTAVSKISRGQLVALLLAGRLSGCLLFSSDSFEQFTLTECFLSMLLDGGLLLLLLLPTLLVLRHLEEGTTERAYRLSKTAGVVVESLYIPLCLFVLLLDMVQFSDFASDTTVSGLSVPMLTVVFVVVCVLASFYGVQALARSATVVAVFSVLCLAAFLLALVPEMRWIHVPPPQGDSVQRIVAKAITDLPRTAEVTAIGLLYPYVNGSRTKACVGFAGATTVLSTAVSVASVAVLGDFSGMTAYPFYTAVTAARIGVFQRLDILVIAVWMGTFFIRVTLFCMLFVDRARHLFGKRAAVLSAAVLAVLLSGAALWIQNGSYQGEWAWATHVYWWVLGGSCIVLPLLLWIGGKRREKG